MHSVTLAPERVAHPRAAVDQNPESRDGFLALAGSAICRAEPRTHSDRAFRVREHPLHLERPGPQGRRAVPAEWMAHRFRVLEFQRVEILETDGHPVVFAEVAAVGKPAATVMRRLPAGAVAFDAMGRKVLNPKSGVLFVRERSAVSGEPSAVTKVVIQR